MKKIYDKNELHFALIWIGLYVVLMSVGDSISGIIGAAKIATAPNCLVLALIIYFWLSKNKLKEKYGLCPFRASAGQYFYFVPLVLLATTNLWSGFQLNLTFYETVLYVMSMLCVGFLEEVIFRGFLFKAICKTNVKQAVVISSITWSYCEFAERKRYSGNVAAGLLCGCHRLSFYDNFLQGEKSLALYHYTRCYQQSECICKWKRDNDL